MMIRKTDTIKVKQIDKFRLKLEKRSRYEEQLGRQLSGSGVISKEGTCLLTESS